MERRPMEWAINIVPVSGGPQLPLFRHGPVGGMGATARRLTRIFLRNLTQGGSHKPVPTKNLDPHTWGVLRASMVP